MGYRWSPGWGWKDMEAWTGRSSPESYEIVTLEGSGGGRQKFTSALILGGWSGGWLGLRVKST